MGNQNSNVRGKNSKGRGSTGWTGSKDVVSAKGTARHICAVFSYSYICHMEMNVKDDKLLQLQCCTA